MGTVVGGSSFTILGNVNEILLNHTYKPRLPDTVVDKFGSY